MEVLDRLREGAASASAFSRAIACSRRALALRRLSSCEEY
jgi:hypothetical protein